MGLTKAQLHDKAVERLKVFLTKYGKEINFSTNKKEFFKCDTDKTVECQLIWNKEPICIQDICTQDVILLSDGDVVFCDFMNDRIDTPKFSRLASNLTTEYVNSALIDMERYQGVESTVPVRKKPASRFKNTYKK